MKCWERLPTCVLKSLFLLLFSLNLFALTLSREELINIARRELQKVNPHLRLKGITFYGDRLRLEDKAYLFEVSKENNTYFLDIVEADTLRRVKRIPLKVERLVKIPVAVRDIGAGEVITERDIRWELKPSGGFWEKPFSPVGKVAKVTIRRGKEIKPSMVGVKKITPGRRVKILFVKGPLIIETYGKLLDYARVGDRVRVKRGKKIFFGRLKDENTVVVNLR